MTDLYVAITKHFEYECSFKKQKEKKKEKYEAENQSYLSTF